MQRLEFIKLVSVIMEIIKFDFVNEVFYAEPYAIFLKVLYYFQLSNRGIPKIR